jgi:hypothetical protein
VNHYDEDSVDYIVRHDWSCWFCWKRFALGVEWTNGDLIIFCGPLVIERGAVWGSR